MVEDNVPVWEETQAVDKSSDISKKDNKESLPSFDETQAIDEVLSKASKNDKYDVLSTMLHKGTEGATLGFADEMAGALAAAGRAAGVKGIGGPFSQYELEVPTLQKEELLKSYRNARDLYRQASEQMSKESPYISGTSQLAGGLATAPLLPGGAIAKEASLGQKMLSGAKTGAAAGALMGAGESTADLTTGELAPIAGLGEDIFKSGLLGAGLGGATPLAIEGVKGGAKLTGKVIPEQAKEAFKKGLEGVDVASKQFYTETGKKLEDVVKKVSDPILKRVETQRAEHAKIIGDVDNQIGQITNRIEQSKELDKLSQIAQNKQDINLVENKIHETAKNLQEDVFNAQQGLRKQFDKLDEAAEATGVVPNFIPAISQFEERVQGQVAPELFEKVVKPLRGLYQMEPNVNTYRQLKGELSKLFDNPNPIIRGQAKQAYSTLKNTYLNDLRDAGRTELADQINQTNSRWRNVIQLEDEFIPQIKPEKIGEKLKFYPEAKTVSALESLPAQSAKKIGQAEKFSDLLQALNPDLKQKYQSQMGELMSQKEAVSAFKPQEAKIVDPEMLKLENILKQVKGQIPEQILGLELPTSSKEKLGKELETLLPKFEMRTAEQEAERKLDQAFNFLKSEIGEQAAGEIKKELVPLTKDLKLRKAVGSGQEGSKDLSVSGLVSAATGGLTKAAGKAGLAVKSVQDVMKLGATKLASSTPEEISNFIQKMVATDPAAASYAKVLKEAAGKNQTSRNAIVFGLMQQPEFRKIYKKTEGIQDEESGK